MTTRPSYGAVAPEALKAMQALQKHVRESGLERSLVELVYLRVSQINGCAFCIDMHVKNMRADGEAEGRVDLLAVWREAPLYSDRERAALAWAETVTTLGNDHVGDAAYAEASKAFTERELVELTLAIATINSWNRLGIAFRSPPGRYTPPRREPTPPGGA
jgi:AhpD family alkylhydroperoxidase